MSAFTYLLFFLSFFLLPFPLFCIYVFLSSSSLFSPHLSMWKCQTRLHRSCLFTFSFTLFLLYSPSCLLFWISVFFIFLSPNIYLYFFTCLSSLSLSPQHLTYFPFSPNILYKNSGLSSDKCELLCAFTCVRDGMIWMSGQLFQLSLFFLCLHGFLPTTQRHVVRLIWLVTQNCL